MSDYTPTTEEVRVQFAYPSVRICYGVDRTAEFDRWLAEVKAQAWEEGYGAGIDVEHLGKETLNPYRSEANE